jgi:hypothetical protein
MKSAETRLGKIISEKERRRTEGRDTGCSGACVQEGAKKMLVGGIGDHAAVICLALPGRVSHRGLRTGIPGAGGRDDSIITQCHR